MIKTITHKGLKRFFETGNTKGIRADHVSRLEERLGLLDMAENLDGISAKNWGLHPLKGDKAGQWAIKVNGNWRLFFKFEDGNIYLLDYNDYH